MLITDRYKVVLACASCFLSIVLLLGPLFPGQETEASPSAAATLYSVQLPGDQVQYSSPIMADLDGDGPKEIIVGGKDGNLHVVNSNGTVRWTASTGQPIQSSPAAGDLDGDGDMEVVVTTGGEPGSTSGGVYAYNNNDGSPFWSSPFLTPAGIFSSPALGDLDKNGRMEVAFGCWDNRIYVLNYDGTKLWDYDNNDTVWSSPALADLTGDGNLEIIIGADAAGISGGYLYVFNKDKTVLVQKAIDQAVFSSPAIGDVDGDNELDIVVGTGPMFAGKGHSVYAWDRNGNPLSGWPVSTAGYMSPAPALADLDGDGTLDVVAVCEDPWLVYAWRGDGSQLFATSITPSVPVPLRYNSPVVADYDGDGTLEVLVAANWSIQAIDASGAQETDASDYNARYTILASPTVGDIDNDGHLEMAIGGSDIADSSFGYLHIWRVGSTAGAGLPWPMFHHDAQHTGLIGVPAGAPHLSVSPDSMPIMNPAGRDASSGVFIIRNTGGGTINWTSSVNPAMPAPVNITLDPANGTVAEASMSAVTVIVEGLASVPTGSHNLAQVTISGTSGGAAVDGSPQTVDLTLQVGDLVWTPSIMK